VQCPGIQVISFRLQRFRGTNFIGIATDADAWRKERYHLPDIELDHVGVKSPAILVQPDERRRSCRRRVKSFFQIRSNASDFSRESFPRRRQDRRLSSGCTRMRLLHPRDQAPMSGRCIVLYAKHRVGRDANKLCPETLRRKEMTWMPGHCTR